MSQPGNVLSMGRCKEGVGLSTPSFPHQKSQSVEALPPSLGRRARWGEGQGHINVDGQTALEVRYAVKN